MQIYTKIGQFLVAIAIVSFFFSLLPGQPLNAEELDSANYKIQGATLSGGEIGESASYQLINTIGEFTGDPYVQSANYILKTGSTETFIADVPSITCFETTTDGSSSCTTGPAYLNSDGMVRVCGGGGCYDRARIEFSTSNNPSDTLYGIQISTDNFINDIQQIDGITMKPKDLSLRNIADYKSKSSWETPSTNIRGLLGGEQYWVQVTALHGDFTESSPSPIQTATTANADVEFDIDIAIKTGTSTETSPPYSITFAGSGALIAGGGIQTADNLVWLDIVTNAYGGAGILQKGVNAGLYSTIESHLISSVNGDLAGLSEGFGLQNYDYSGSGVYSSHYSGSGTGELGSITVTADYLPGTLQKVGPINTSFVKMYDADGPVVDGRVAAYLKAKAAASTAPNTDYQEVITFIIVPRY